MPGYEEAIKTLTERAKNDNTKLEQPMD
jgi:hypothetical protein